MPFAQSLNYTDVSNIVYAQGRMQAIIDASLVYMSRGFSHPDFLQGTYDDLANRIITGWTSATSIDEDWQLRDRNCLRDMYNLGYRHVMKMEDER